MGCANSIDQQIAAPTRQQSINLSQQQSANSRPQQFMNIRSYQSAPSGHQNDAAAHDRQEQIIYPEKYHFDLVHAERVEFSCFDGHGLFRVVDLKTLYSGTYYKDNLYYCSLCGMRKDCRKDPTTHCAKCEFDICSKCFEAQQNIEFTCISGHRLFKIQSLKASHLGKAYKSGQYICNCCGKLLQDKEDPSYHCPQCQFDMCPLCARQQQKSEHRCSTGHNLFRVTDLKTFHNGRAYRNNLYSCNFCHIILQAEEHPVTHCSLCKFSVCPDCVKADKISSKNRSLKRSNSFGNNGADNKVELEIKDNCNQNNNTEIILDTKIACVICLKDIRSYIFDPCRHLCTCELCSWTLLKDERSCPICRKQIKNVMKIFIA